MLKQFLIESMHVTLPVVGMVFFMLFFAAVLLRVLSRDRRKHYEDMSRLPLEPEGEDGGATGREAEFEGRPFTAEEKQG